MIKDTIAAIATAMTASGIGIIRISGEEAFVIVDRIYKGKKKEKSSQMRKATRFIMDTLWMEKRRSTKFWCFL